MPNDIHRWEEGGALVHHCPVCATPLSNPRSQKKCLGDHVEWCRRYHHQLFKKGGSVQCMACNSCDDQQDKRCRHIAELIQTLRLLDPKLAPAIVSPTASPASTSYPSPGLTGSATKKDRKDAKKAAKAATRPPPIRAEDIKRIGHILHPVDKEEADFEQALLNDDDINMNRYYHRGTANTTEMRHRFIKQHRAGLAEPVIQKADMKRILAELKVPEKASGKLEKALVEQIRNAVQEDLIHVHGEEQQTMMRKTSFWRWASKKAYARLLAHGMIWDWKITDGGYARVDAVAGAEDVDRDEPVEAVEGLEEGMENFGLGDDTTPELSADDEPSDASRAGAASTPNTSRNTSASSESRGRRLLRDEPEPELEDDGWTPIAKAKSGRRAKAPPPIRVKMEANHGLGHLMMKSTPRFGLGQMGFFRDEDEENQ
ncbi:hypothetical protein B0A48_05052 [Cryoendolithus antarcticus]|uniref:Uncharacterized protein n=1 Tax=Cryoendolithus antarcticus TaxID=1507870 RepID=A0A1V8TE45_9PEZI|nr:hypothetical protein B0A48_05052 [Cryoendolithus antarcticus]